VKEVKLLDVDGNVKIIIMAYKKSGFKMKGYTYPGKSPLNKKGPCWEGYEMIGMKTKGGRKVPNCVPKK
jgi:hypothetical protein